jgi:hypothetical protein
MATFEKRIGNAGKVTWRARVRRQSGPSLTKSFPKKADAEQWARTIEHKRGTSAQIGVRQCTQEFLDKNPGRSTTSRIGQSK